MDNFISNLINRLETLDCKICAKLHNKLKIISNEGIDYDIKINWKDNSKIYILENDYFYKKGKIGKYNFKSKYFDENSVIDMFEHYILLNDLYFNGFKIGMEHCINNTEIETKSLLNDIRYLNFKDEIDIHRCMTYVLEKGYEFANKYPLPQIVEKQYNLLRERAIENINIETVKEFMLKNKNIHIYLDEKKVTDVIENLQNIKEIEYSYGHIVAKSYTYNIKMNLLPLEGEIIIFDIEGINEIAKCNVNEYKEIYKKEIIKNLFKNIEDYEQKNFIIEREKDEQDKD